MFGEPSSVGARVGWIVGTNCKVAGVCSGIMTGASRTGCIKEDSGTWRMSPVSVQCRISVTVEK
jgi:hypothetical protein